MTASESSYIGLAKQTAKGTPNVTDASFTYFLFSDGGIGPENVVLPLDQEVGGGALLRNVIKAGVLSRGSFGFIPRPLSLGHFLLGALGLDTISGTGPSYTHAFTLPTNQFTAPYWTIRSAPGDLWGETFQDARVNALTLNWRSPGYVRGGLGFLGGLPTPNVTKTTWAPATYLDSGPQFITPISDIELPTATNIKVLGGTFSAAIDIPMDEQWIVGSYNPDDFDINSRIFAVSFIIKISDAVLYNKMSYDPANGAAWVADMFREADFKLQFLSDQEADTGVPYSLLIEGNGQSGDDANVVWQATPINLRAGSQITMAVNGTFLASPTADAPITITLVNTKALAY